MTDAQERSITLALNILHVGFFECPAHFYEYFLTNDEWALVDVGSGYHRITSRHSGKSAEVAAASTRIEALISSANISQIIRLRLPKTSPARVAVACQTS